MSVVPTDLGDVRLRRDSERIHRLGPRAIEEMLVEIGRDRLLRTYVEKLAAKYAAINPALLALIEGWR